MTCSALQNSFALQVACRVMGSEKWVIKGYIRIMEEKSDTIIVFRV